jgi:hypothetical protein
MEITFPTLTNINYINGKTTISLNIFEQKSTITKFSW